MLTIDEKIEWLKAIRIDEVPENGGTCIKVENEQIAIFNYAKRKKWYATQNLCPHKQQMVLSRGMIGDKCGEPKVACPFHKKNFSLETGDCLTGEDFRIKTYPVKIENGFLYINVSSIYS